jgi:hypothetical protein
MPLTVAHSYHLDDDGTVTLLLLFDIIFVMPPPIGGDGDIHTNNRCYYSVVLKFVCAQQTVVVKNKKTNATKHFEIGLSQRWAMSSRRNGTVFYGCI